MGREIRRVPPGWEHPRKSCNHSPWNGGCDDAKAHGGRCYQPLYDRDFETAAREWLDEAIAWDNGTHKDLDDCPELKREYPFYWQWGGSPPNDDYYRPKWTAEPTAYQVYETVSEGTPVSPVFETLDALVAWLIGQGYSEHAAREFAKDGWAPSMVMSGGRVASNIHAFDILPEK